ncbi:MAG: fumarate hydratase, partial [Spirochaetae bacterium HGW-Spirochaetae-6]
MDKSRLVEKILDLIKTTVTKLPEDVEQALLALPDSPIVEVMKETMAISGGHALPICQDTGYPYFLVKLAPADLGYYRLIEESVSEALVRATLEGFLRPNAVDPLTQRNPGNNLGPGLPYIEWELGSQEGSWLYLLLKGGGSENVSAQYALPFSAAGAGRDIRGVINTLLYHVEQIQGHGCSPGILGVGIGGDRSLSMKLAKKQLFRSINDINPDENLRKIEDEVLARANKLGIGPMGLGGESTLLSVKAGAAARHPASFYVSVAYLCWV